MLERAVKDFLKHSGLAEKHEIAAERMSGGVSSDIWKISTPEQTFVLKRALPALRVPQVWEAPLSRNANEVKWLETVYQIMPDAVPRVLAHDKEAAMFAMEFLRYPVWKEQLKAGNVDVGFAAKVGSAIAEIHSSTAGSPAIAADFSTSATFDALRIEPYISATAEVHPDLAEPLTKLAAETLGTKLALVHGDVSPKNILAGRDAPIFLDAECAWYGEPAFDLAFCLNHLLLKCIWVPERRQELSSAFEALREAYLERVDWEPRSDIEARTARLLPALFLARVDGKSPVEYIDRESDKQTIRLVARPFVIDPTESLSEFKNEWIRKLSNA